MNPEQYNATRRTGELYTRLLDALCDMDNLTKEIEKITDEVMEIRMILQNEKQTNE